MKPVLFIALFVLFTSAVFSQQTVGFFFQNPGSEDGYVLFSAVYNPTVYLIDKCGDTVHTWKSQYITSRNVELLPDGSLLHPRAGGVIEKLDWNSNVIWSYYVNNDSEYQSHEAHAMPNGDILVIMWTIKSAAEAINNGVDSALLQGATTMLATKIIELQPIGTDSANIVWQWDSWDHLIQDYDSTKPHYGDVARSPGLININYIDASPVNGNAIELLHTNAVDYNPFLDQVMISNRAFSEVWIIDHSTTTAQAASHSGGKYGKGGDLLYRWGNDTTFDHGTNGDETLFGQHNAQWIDTGLNGAGNILVFNNGYRRPGYKYSDAEELIPSIDSSGGYTYIRPYVYGPDSAVWKDTMPGFYSYAIGGVQRLKNGNTLICDGENGAFYEVDSSDSVEWKYVCPVDRLGPVSQGTITDSNIVFRCLLYEPTYSGLAGETLTPGSPIEINPLPNSCSTSTGTNILNVSPPEIVAQNPFYNSIVITSFADETNLSGKLINNLGVVVQEWQNINLNKGISTTIETPALPGGIYFLKLNNAQFNATIKLVCVK